MNNTHVMPMFWTLFLFVSAKLELCLGWCNIPASCSDYGYCVFHWKQRRKITLHLTEMKKKKRMILFILLSSVKVFSFQRIMRKSQTVSMYCTEYRYRYKCCIWLRLFIFELSFANLLSEGLFLKCPNMSWSGTDRRKSKEQSFMSFLFFS